MATREQLGDISPVDVYLNLQEQLTEATGGVLPKVSSTDNGMILKVSSGEWAKGSETVELPAVTAENNGAVLKVDAGAWAIGAESKELPAYPSTAGTYKLQLVVADGVGTLTWEAVP